MCDGGAAFSGVEATVAVVVDPAGGREETGNEIKDVAAVGAVLVVEEAGVVAAEVPDVVEAVVDGRHENHAVISLPSSPICRPVHTGQGFVFDLEGGDLFVLDGSGTGRRMKELVPGDEDSKMARMRAIGNNQVLVQSADGIVVRVDVKTGEVIGGYRGSNGAPARALRTGDRIAVGFAKANGVVDIYRD